MPEEYSPEEVAALIESADVQLVDVREADEWAAGRIAGATHIELGDLSMRAGEIDRERPVVFYCRSGSRSAMATQAFVAAGYEAHNLAGGLQEWKARGLPLVPAGGFVA
jgi:rhodanese-related sulfurtransferase